jgi:hypothetical protein
VSVLQGSLELGSGTQRVRLEAGEIGQVSATGALASAGRMLPTPRPLRPSGGASFRYRRLPPQIEFRWAVIPRATRYRLIVMREGSDRSVVLDERVAWPALTVGRLGDGRYQWRVSALFGELEGFPTEWRTLTVVYEAGAGTTGPDTGSGRR